MGSFTLRFFTILFILTHFFVAEGEARRRNRSQPRFRTQQRQRFLPRIMQRAPRRMQMQNGRVPQGMFRCPKCGRFHPINQQAMNNQRVAPPAPEAPESQPETQPETTPNQPAPQSGTPKAQGLPQEPVPDLTPPPAPRAETRTESAPPAPPVPPAPTLPDVPRAAAANSGTSVKPALHSREKDPAPDTQGRPVVHGTEVSKIKLAGDQLAKVGGPDCHITDRGFSADGNSVLVMFFNGKYARFNTQRGNFEDWLTAEEYANAKRPPSPTEIKTSFPGRNPLVTPDGRVVVTDDETETKVWDIASQTQIGAFPRGSLQDRASKMSADGNFVIVQEEECQLSIRSLGRLIGPRSTSDKDKLVEEIESEDPKTALRALEAIEDRREIALDSVFETFLKRRDTYWLHQRELAPNAKQENERYLIALGRLKSIAEKMTPQSETAKKILALQN